jgi:hypothetical protein
VFVFAFIQAWSGQSGSGFVPQSRGAAEAEPAGVLALAVAALVAPEALPAAGAVASAPPVGIVPVVVSAAIGEASGAAVAAEGMALGRGATGALAFGLRASRGGRREEGNDEKEMRTIEHGRELTQNTRQVQVV